jgi:hypothetical protein
MYRERVHRLSKNTQLLDENYITLFGSRDT